VGVVFNNRIYFQNGGIYSTMMSFVKANNLLVPRMYVQLQELLNRQNDSRNAEMVINQVDFISDLFFQNGGYYSAIFLCFQDY
jgi:hypothetical protein